MPSNGILKHLPWALLGLVGAAALAFVATERGEPVNAIWIVVAAVYLLPQGVAGVRLPALRRTRS